MADTLEIKVRDGQLLLRLRVAPKAGRDRVAGVHAGALKVQTAAAPEKGKANDAVIRLLARALDISPRQIELVSGHTSQDKQVAISGISEAALRALETSND